MPEPVKEAVVVDPEEKELRAELEADGELLDDAGKPLPWNHPKRVRQIYKDAKEGRKTSATLKDLGLKAADIPALVEELSQFRAAYAEYQKELKSGKTTDTEDDEAIEARKQAERIRKQLKALKVKFEDDEEPEKQAQATEAFKQKTVMDARDKIVDLMTEAGYDLDTMDADDRGDLLDEIDFKVGQKLQRDKEGIAAFVRGSLRPIEKYTKQVLEAMGKSEPRIPKASGIKNLPPHLRGSSPGSVAVKKVDTPEPKNTREAAEQMAADLKARREAGK